MFQEILQKYIIPGLMPVLLGAATTAITAGVTFGMLKLKEWMKIKEPAARADTRDKIRGELYDLMLDVVEDIEANAKKGVPLYLADGKIDPEEAANLKKLAIARTLDLYGPRAKEAALKILGYGSDELLNLLGTYVESALSDVKRANALKVTAQDLNKMGPGSTFAQEPKGFTDPLEGTDTKRFNG